MSRGIAILTAMQAEPDNIHAALPVLSSYFEDGITYAELYQSMVNVSQLVLIRLEKLAGRDPFEELRYLSERYGEHDRQSAAAVRGRPSPSSRCAEHRRARTRVRTANRATARAVIAASPVCADCGATRDLLSDHVVPLARGGSIAGAQRTLCRPCNSRRGGRLADGGGGRGRQ